LIILDAGHNPGAIKEIANTLSYISNSMNVQIDKMDNKDKKFVF